VVDRLRRGQPTIQNLVLLVLSLLFYLYGSGQHLLLLLAVVGVTYLAGLAIHHTRWRKAAAAVGITIQVGCLGFFKYANFFVDQAATVSGWLDGPRLTSPGIVLPVGISFFTFQAISYLVDIYRREQQPLRNPLDVALFISMFPQLIAGPIVRYGEVAAQLLRRSSTSSDVALGASRFTWGLFKKVWIADSVAAIADAAYGLPISQLNSASALLGAFAYGFQIYFDFSAYSDMAIGLGRIFGFTFPENFVRPYSAVSITDFWRRWHQTLSFWFRDYVYIPLGGSRKGAIRTYVNLWTVFLLSGFWHGAAWTFVIWGAYHGFWLSVERRLRKWSGPTLPVPVRRGITFVLAVVGFTIFRAESLEQGWTFYTQMFWPSSFDLHVNLLPALTHRNLLVFALCFGTVLLPGTFTMGRWLSSAQPSRVRSVARVLVAVVAAAMVSANLATSNFSPFIYFRF
jgi:alginate O-acetyltransferase complex protein AlgI